MKLKTYFSLLMVALTVMAFTLLPKTVSSSCPNKTDENIKKTEAAIAVAETEDLKDELLFRY